MAGSNEKGSANRRVWQRDQTSRGNLQYYDESICNPAAYFSGKAAKIHKYLWYVLAKSAPLGLKNPREKEMNHK